MPKRRGKRPAFITLVAVLNFLGGLLLCAFSFNIINVPDSALLSELIWTITVGGSIAELVGLVIPVVGSLVVFGVLSVLVGYLMWYGHKWGFYLGLLGYGVGVGVGIISCVLQFLLRLTYSFSAIIMLFVSAAFFFLLYAKDSQSWFAVKFNALNLLGRRKK